MRQHHELDELRRKLAEAQENLEIILYRKSQYISDVEVPLYIVREERKWRQNVKDIEAQIDALNTDVQHTERTVQKTNKPPQRPQEPLTRQEIPAVIQNIILKHPLYLLVFVLGFCGFCNILTTSIETNTFPIPQQPEVVAFSSSNTSSELDAAFGWRRGASADNHYTVLATTTLRLHAASHPEPWWDAVDAAPIITLPYEGNFIAQVKVTFEPNRKAQGAGIGIRVKSDDSHWFRVTHSYDENQHIQTVAMFAGAARESDRDIYAGSEVFLRIVRRYPSVSAAYSTNGIHWEDLRTENMHNVTGDIQIYLIAYTAESAPPVNATLSDFIITPLE